MDIMIEWHVLFGRHIPYQNSFNGKTKIPQQNERIYTLYIFKMRVVFALFIRTSSYSRLASIFPSNNEL